MGKKVTIKDIADKLGVSKSTVSKALSDATDISKKTREMILSCAIEMGYVDKTDMNFRSNVLMLIYAIDYSDINQFGYELLMGFQSAAKEDSLGVTILTVNEEEMRTGSYVNKFNFDDYSGSFFVGFKPHERFVRKMEENQLPAVVLDDECDSQYAARIGSDSACGIRQAVQHLYQLGRRKFAFIGGEEDSLVTIERKEAYEKALKKYELTLSYASYASFTHKFKDSVVMSVAKADAVICASDEIAAQAVKILLKNNIKVPEDICIVGYDNLPSSKYSTPSITTIAQNRIELGRTAYKIIKMINSGDRISKFILRPELILRKSTGQEG